MSQDPILKGPMAVIKYRIQAIIVIYFFYYFPSVILYLFISLFLYNSFLYSSFAIVLLPFLFSFLYLSFYFLVPLSFIFLSLFSSTLFPSFSHPSLSFSFPQCLLLCICLFLFVSFPLCYQTVRHMAAMTFIDIGNCRGNVKNFHLSCP